MVWVSGREKTHVEDLDEVARETDVCLVAPVVKVPLTWIND